MRLMLLTSLLLPLAAAAALPSRLADGSELPSLAPMLERTTPAVVNIATYTTVQVRNPLLEDPFFRRFFNVPDQRRYRRTQSAGSGVVVDAQRGYIVTNHHVVNRADEVAVTLADGRTVTAELVGADPQVDLAVLKVAPEDLTQIEFADSTALRVGDFVVAIGNPFGLNQTVTSGIVSALGRSGLGIEGYEDFIQTDASINPGNSGGALVDLSGRLVGINTAIIAPSGGNVGIGFAIPANMVRAVMAQIIEHGQVRRGYLGLDVQALNADLADAFGLDAPRRCGGGGRGAGERRGTCRSAGRRRDRARR
jgi:S1-C subfamily serine protease